MAYEYIKCKWCERMIELQPNSILPKNKNDYWDIIRYHGRNCGNCKIKDLETKDHYELLTWPPKKEGWDNDRI